MKNISSLFLLFAALFTVVSCNKIPEHAKYIPKNAIGVFSVDMDKISKKLIWNVLTGSKIFEELQKDIKNEESKKAMKDFSNIGLDPGTTVYFYYTGNMKNENHPCALVAMKDAAKFESFISKNYPDLPIEDQKNYKTCLVEQGFLVAWNKDVAIGVPVKDFTGMGMDTGAAVQIDMSKIESEKAFIKQSFEISSSNAITNLDNFSQLQKDGHDVAIWINYEELYKQNKDLSGEMQAFIKDEYFKDAGLATGFDFEDGAVNMEMDYFFSKELAAIYKKYSNENIDADLVKNIPSKDISLLIAYNLKPKMIQDFLQQFKLDGLANLGLMAMGTSMDAIINTFKGDMMFAVTDMKSKAASTDTAGADGYYMDDTPDMNMTFAMNISDQAGLEKLLSKGVEESVLSKSGNTYTMVGNTNAGALMFDKSRLVYSNKMEIAQQFIDNRGNAKEGIPADAWKNITGNPISLYADIKKMLEAAPMKSDEPDEQQLIKDIKSMFTYAQIFGGKMKGNANHLEGNLFFTNKSENSMIQLLNLAIKAKAISDKKNSAPPPAI